MHQSFRQSAAKRQQRSGVMERAAVLSDSTEAYDRGEEFAHYRRIPSLRDYLLVLQREAQIEHYRRNEDDTWTLREVRARRGARPAPGAFP